MRGIRAAAEAVAPLPPWVLSAALLALPVAAPATVAPQLQGMLRRARVAVAGDVADVTPYDHGRLAVATVHTVKTFKGEIAGDTVRVVEMRNRPSATPVFRAGASVTVFLRPADKNSYLRQQLPAGDYYQIVSDHSCLSATSPTEAAETRAIVERIARMQSSPQTDPQRRAEADRALTFDLIAAHDTTLVQDGALSLGELPGLATTLQAEERQRLEKALGRDDLPPYVRVALVKGIGAAKLAALAPVLRGMHNLPADVQAAVWAALAQLGAPPTQEQWENELSSGEAGVRAAAVREYLRATGAAGIPRAATVALHDRDTSVRVAAIESLGATKRTEALPPLQETFSDPSPDVYQASVRAIDEIGGRPAAEALAKLVYAAPPQNQRLALVALLTMVSRDDPLVVQIEENHPNPEMRDLIEHGLKLRE